MPTPVTVIVHKISVSVCPMLRILKKLQLDLRTYMYPAPDILTAHKTSETCAWSLDHAIRVRRALGPRKTCTWTCFVVDVPVVGAAVQQEVVHLPSTPVVLQVQRRQQHVPLSTRRNRDTGVTSRPSSQPPLLGRVRLIAATHT